MARNRRTKVRQPDWAKLGLDLVVEQSCFGLLIVSQDGGIQFANRAACALLVFPREALLKESIYRVFPDFDIWLESNRHQEKQPCLLHQFSFVKGTGEIMPVWVGSTRIVRTLGRFFVIDILDSAQIRELEDLYWQQLVASYHLTLRVLQHEVRNMCAAASMLLSSMRDLPVGGPGPEFDVLHSLLSDIIQAVESAEKEPDSGVRRRRVLLKSVVDQLMAIARPYFEEIGARITCNIPQGIWIMAEPGALLRVFINLSNNARRAIEKSSHREFSITAVLEDERVLVRFSDTGPGVLYPEHLFRPTHPSAENMGVGLFISRAIVRGFQGELRYERTQSVTCFIVELELSEEMEP